MYYAGLPSHPPLVARSSSFLWQDPEAYPEETNVGSHPVIIERLKSMLWAYIDVWRIGESSPPLRFPGKMGFKIALSWKDVLIKPDLFVSPFGQAYTALNLKLERDSTSRSSVSEWSSGSLVYKVSKRVWMG